MTLRYVAEKPDAESYLALFESTGWNEMYDLSASQLKQAVGKSWRAMSAYDGEALVGFGRLLSDGVLYAVMFDVIVLPARQREGIGGEIVRYLLWECVEAGIRDVLLFSARGTAEFYRRFGFESRPGYAPGMLLRTT
ncbi:MAG: GNAT family N-acetyltransferase [Gemmatimonadota bacterium]